MQVLICPAFRTLAEPDFFVVAEAGPTYFPDDETPGDDPVTTGFIPLMLTQGGVGFQYSGQKKNQKLLIRRPELPRVRP